MAVLDLQGMEAKSEHGIVLPASGNLSITHYKQDDASLLIRP